MLATKTNTKLRVMIFTDEQWKIVKECGPHFRTARQDYVRNAPMYLTQMLINIYESATGKTLANKDVTCAGCVLRVYQTVGKAYFSDLEERENLEKEKLEKEENKDVITETNAKSNQRDEKKKVGSNRNGKKRGIENKN